MHPSEQQGAVNPVCFSMSASMKGVPLIPGDWCNCGTGWNRLFPDDPM